MSNLERFVLYNGTNPTLISFIRKLVVHEI